MPDIKTCIANGKALVVALEKVTTMIDRIRPRDREGLDNALDALTEAEMAWAKFKGTAIFVAVDRRNAPPADVPATPERGE